MCQHECRQTNDEAEDQLFSRWCHDELTMVTETTNHLSQPRTKAETRFDFDVDVFISDRMNRH